MIHFVSPADASRWLGLLAGVAGLVLCWVVRLDAVRQRQENGHSDVSRGLLGFTVISFAVSIVGQVMS